MEQRGSTVRPASAFLFLPIEALRWTRLRPVSSSQALSLPLQNLDGRATHRRHEREDPYSEAHPRALRRVAQLILLCRLLFRIVPRLKRQR